MIQVLREGTRNRIECDYCGALLAYDKEDIQKEKTVKRKGMTPSFFDTGE